MPASLARLKIRDLMILVAVAAGMFELCSLLFAGWGSVVLPLMLVLLALAILYPVRHKRVGRGLLVATWASALWPVSIPLSLHTAWTVASLHLGHHPGPADNGEPIEFLTVVVFVFMVSSLVSTLVCLCLPFGAVATADEAMRRWNPQAIPLLVMPLIWSAVGAILRWDPVGAGEWWID